jgi:hypothetical protein
VTAGARLSLTDGASVGLGARIRTLQRNAEPGQAELTLDVRVPIR